VQRLERVYAGFNFGGERLILAVVLLVAVLVLLLLVVVVLLLLDLLGRLDHGGGAKSRRGLQKLKVGFKVGNLVAGFFHKPSPSTT
jgi:hypothetical protein